MRLPHAEEKVPNRPAPGCTDCTNLIGPTANGGPDKARPTSALAPASVSRVGLTSVSLIGPTIVRKLGPTAAYFINSLTRALIASAQIL